MVPTHWRIVALIVAAYGVINAVALFLDPYFLRLTTWDFQFTAARIANYYDAARTDVLFMGTSRTTLGFNPTIADQEIKALTGESLSTLNLGLTGGAIDVNYLILKNVISDAKKPRIIVYGVTDVELSVLNGTGVTRLPYSSFLLRPDDFSHYSGTSFDDRASFLLKQACPFCRSTEAIHNGVSLALDADRPAKTAPPANGYYDVGQTRASPEALETERKTYEAELRPFRVSYDRLATFGAFLELARTRGIWVVLVNMPVAPEFMAFWDGPASVERYRAAVQGLAADHDVPLLDLYSDGWRTLPPDAFVDRNHLNSEGAAALTRTVTDEYVVPGLATSAPISDPASFYRAGYSQVSFPATVRVGQPIECSLIVQNQASRLWPAGNQVGDVLLGWRWRDSSGRDLQLAGRAPLLRMLLPGQQQQLHFTVQAPPTPGPYLLELGLVYEGVAWFADQGTPPLTYRLEALAS